jgi:AraC-like DNA-binding protein
VSLVVPPTSPALRPYVASIGYYEGSPPRTRERILPTAGIDLMVSLSDDRFTSYSGGSSSLSAHTVTSPALGGPHSTFTVIDTSPMRAMVDVQFRTGRAAPFFGVPLAEMCDTLVPLGDLWGSDGALLRERLLAAPTPQAKISLLEAVLLERLSGAGAADEQDRAIESAIGSLERGHRVRDVVEEFGTTAKPFIRRFVAATGLAPKRFARVRRLQRVLTSLSPDRPVDWADLAAGHGYFDQAHLVNEFRALTGLRPGDYLPQPAGATNHVAA